MTTYDSFMAATVALGVLFGIVLCVLIFVIVMVFCYPTMLGLQKKIQAAK